MASSLLCCVSAEPPPAPAASAKTESSGLLERGGHRLSLRAAEFPMSAACAVVGLWFVGVSSYFHAVEGWSWLDA
eukprot:4816453-Prymnesium_polylepis.1